MVTDILFNDDGTFKESNGDFLFGNAEAFLMEDILLAVPGHYKEFPTIGANAYRFINARASKQVISREIKVALKADVFKRPILNLDNYPTIYIDNFELELSEDGV